MKAFLFGVALQWKLDLRNKGILITYYLVPLFFFLFVSTIFASVNSEAKDTLIESMTIFAITMGAFLGTPIPLVELYSGDIKKAYQVGGIPLWTGVVNNVISAFVHLMITSFIIFIIAPIGYDAKIPQYPVRYFGFLAIFLITCLSIGTVLGLFVKSVTKLTMYSQILFQPSLMLSGIMFPRNMLPEALEYVGNAFPATWGLRILTNPIPELWWFLPLVLFFAAACLLSIYKLAKIAKE